MRRCVAVRAATVLAALSVLVATFALASQVSEATPQRNIPTLAYYYQWFNRSSWDRAKIDFPLAGRYASDDVAIMRRHIDEAKQAGIDGFIVSWKDSPVNNRRLESLMTVAAAEDFKLAVIYQGLDFDRNPLPVDVVAADLGLFNRRYAGDPVFKIFSRPLLIWSGTWKFSTADIERTTRPLRSSLTILATEKSPESYQRVFDSFDGDAYYWSSVDPATNSGYADKLHAMGTTVHRLGGLWIAPFAPGFDARLVGGTREVPRRDGETLRTEYNAAITSSPDALGLISWNEFSENTHVEPSQKYGDKTLSVLASLTAGGQVTVSELAADSDQGTRSESALTVESGLVVLLLLLVGVTVVGLRSRPKQATKVPSGPSGPAASMSSHLRVRRGIYPSLLIAALLVLGIIVALAVNSPRGSAGDVTRASPLYLGAQPVRDPHHVVVAAAGDISCPADKARLGEEPSPNSCRMQQTADLVATTSPDAVLPLGDNQYPSGTLKDFQAVYARSWGAFRSISFPVAGNHEYGTPQARGYYSYFGSRAGEPDKGYYSYDLGSWHIVALNSECLHVGGCSASSPQATWLREDLAAHPRKCTLAYWHRPRFSSGAHGNNLDNDALWTTVVAAKTDLVLNGHDHDYERLSPMDAEGVAENTGTAEMVVGTGGASHYKFHLPLQTSVARVKGENGILRLELTDGGYLWQFLQAPGGRVLDAGSARCQ